MDFFAIVIGISLVGGLLRIAAALESIARALREQSGEQRLQHAFLARARSDEP